MSKVNEALACFNGGFNCAQAILSTYCEDFGLDQEVALKLSCGFGAGMGRRCETCGAVTGAYMLISLANGQYIKDDINARETTYALIQEFSKQFEERNKTTICRELLGVDFTTGNNDFAMSQVKAICPKMVRDAAEIIETLVLKG